LLDLPRSTFYHVSQPVSPVELDLMKQIDRCHMKYPFYGSRRIRDWLADEGHLVNRKCVQRLMRTMEIVAVYPKRNLSLANQARKVYPYLLRNLEIAHPNQVWATDITYCAPSLRRQSRMLLSKLEHVWNASRITLEEINWMPALCYGGA
jgi:putative transposase